MAALAGGSVKLKRAESFSLRTSNIESKTLKGRTYGRSARINKRKLTHAEPPIQIYMNFYIYLYVYVAKAHVSTYNSHQTVANAFFYPIFR